MDTDEYFNVFDQKWYIQPEKDDVGTGFISTGSNHESWCGSGEWFGTAIYPPTIYGVVTGYTRGVMALMRPDGSDLWFVPQIIALQKLLFPKCCYMPFLHGLGRKLDYW